MPPRIETVPFPATASDDLLGRATISSTDLIALEEMASCLKAEKVLPACPQLLILGNGQDVPKPHPRPENELIVSVDQSAPFTTETVTRGIAHTLLERRYWRESDRILRYFGIVVPSALLNMATGGSNILVSAGLLGAGLGLFWKTHRNKKNDVMPDSIYALHPPVTVEHKPRPR